MYTVSTLKIQLCVQNAIHQLNLLAKSLEKSNLKTPFNLPLAPNLISYIYVRKN